MDYSQVIYESIIKNNPKFAEFVKENQGKTPERIAQEHGIDYNSVLKLFNMKQ